MSNDVFISYRRKDLTFVTQLHNELTQRGISAWFDKESIEVADHWRTSIAEGIRDCKVFILVLSPDAVQSPNIRKEVDLAETHNKRIVPLLWRKTDIPPAFEYALAGIQWIDFNETASVENFNQLAEVVTRLLGGATAAEAAKDQAIAVESTIPAIPKEAAHAPAVGERKLGGGRMLGGGRTLGATFKQNPLVIGGKVISSVVTAFDILGPEDQDFLSEELKWLFNAINHLYTIQRNEVDIDQPISVPVPPEAQYLPQADNVLLPQYRDPKLITSIVNDLEANLKRINDHLGNLKQLLDREIFGGEEAKRNVNLQNQIKEQRLEIVKILNQQLASTMDFYYGIKITAPRQLYDLLQGS